MDKFLRPDKFDCQPNSSNASKEWSHWFKTFETFLRTIPSTSAEEQAVNKLDILINFISSEVYETIKSCDTYDVAIAVLKDIYIKPQNEMFVRHVLATRKQNSGETIDEYFQVLKQLSSECTFNAVSSEQYKQEYIRDAFIRGISSSVIRQRLLESSTLDLDAAFTQARSLELAQKNCESYTFPSVPVVCDTSNTQIARIESQDVSAVPDSAAMKRTKIQTCFFCGHRRHPRTICPAKDALCGNCGKKGHFALVCRAKNTSASTSLAASNLHITASCLSKATVNLLVNGRPSSALIDTGSSDSFIDESFVGKHHIRVFPTKGMVSMATSSLSTAISGFCKVELILNGERYRQVKLSVLTKLCSSLILGQDFMKRHKSVSFDFGGNGGELKVCSLAQLNIESPSLFSNIVPNCKPIAIKSRRYSIDDRKFIENEIERLLKEGIIEQSTSPWRAQIVITKNENHKKRMVIDYSQTINKFTQLDAYPLPKIQDLINTIANYRIFSKIDLRSAYHQIPIKESDKQYTAFEGLGSLYQFNRMPFGITNGVACFQRVMNQFIEENNLNATFAYIDDITICG